MTQEELERVTAYYRTFPPGSWVQVPRDALLELIDALESAWTACDEAERVVDLKEAYIVTLEQEAMRERG